MYIATMHIFPYEHAHTHFVWASDKKYMSAATSACDLDVKHQRKSFFFIHGIYMYLYKPRMFGECYIGHISVLLVDIHV